MSGVDDRAAKKRPAGLYIHLPFCLSRCGYCTFVSRVYDPGLADAYLCALEGEMRRREYFSADFLPESIFIGGGTPSCLSLEQLERVLCLLPQPIRGEATCEMNPDSCSREKLRLLAAYGINRISFGVQTFDRRGLRILQRRHGVEEARRAVELAVGMGFRSVSVDLIHGWPGQGEGTLVADVEEAVALGVRHVSSYSLIVDPDAVAYEEYRCRLGGDEVDEETGRRYWEETERVLEGHGFEHYETSNFCRPGYRCRHNVDIWCGGEYVGIGLGACSHLGGERRGNIADIGEYIRRGVAGGEVAAYCEWLGGEEKARECAVFWLRLFEGVDEVLFRERTGYDFCVLYERVLPGLLAAGVMEMGGGRVWVARAYQPVLDSVLEWLI